MKEKKKISIFWFRRDLRITDNHALHQALSGDAPVLPIFIFDPSILGTLHSNDHRVEFIHEQISQINQQLKVAYGSGVGVYLGSPREVFTQLMEEYSIDSVYVNHDYEPYATKRDAEIQEVFSAEGIPMKTFKDQVIFEKSEVVKDDNTPYVVYTPYMKRWRAKFSPQEHLVQYDTDIENYVMDTNIPFLSLQDIGFSSSEIPALEPNISSELISNYGQQRDFPAEEGTSFIGTFLRFGTISIRELVKKAILSDDDTYLKELIWREFFMQIIWHFPHTAGHAFREKYDAVPWRDAPDDLQKWKDGQTGYPMVDAGMRELNATGYMHNRVRMVVASFLCKHLLIDWREGERYFAEKLFDYELSSNVGNWQWAAGSGVDAAPYFRVFNPETQMKKFDPKGEYVRKWVPEYFGIGYVSPMVEHKFARERAIETYKTALNNFEG